MANSGRLEIEIGADVSGLENGISQAERQLRTLESRRDARVRIGADTSELDRRISGVNTRLNELRTSAGTAQTAMRGMTGQVGNGSNALMQFSRIAQDAPYGIIGIGNNLTATAEAFGHLRNQTGSAGGALRAMASSLMGTGGILLGVSLLTTGFTLLAQSGLSVGDIIDKITGKFSVLGEAIKKATEEGGKEAAGQILSMKSLVSAAQNSNITMEERLNFVDKLKKQFPGYYGQLKDEEILYGNLTKVVKSASEALLAKAVAEKLITGGAEIQLSLYKDFAKLDKAKAQTAKSQADFDKAKAISNIQGIIDYQKQINYSKNIEDEIRQRIISTNRSLEARTGIIDKLIAKTGKLEETPISKTKAPKVFKTPQVTGVVSTIIPAPLFDLNGVESFNGQVDQFGNKLKSLPGIIETSMGEIHFAADTGLLELNALLYEFNQEASQLIENSMVNTFAGIGDAIGNAVANGGNVLMAVGNSLLSSLGAFLSDMGGMLIKYGLLAIAKGKIDLAILAGGPVSIGAGIAAVGVGILLKAAGASIGNMAKSGGSTSTSSGSNANSSSRVSGGFSGGGGFGGGTVVFEIAGTSLIGVLNNTQSRNLRIGGTN